MLGIPHDDDITIENVWRRDQGQCYICLTRVLAPGLLDGWDLWAPVIEHVTPISAGGHDTWNNVRLAHRHCNNVKSYRRSAEQAREVVLAEPL